MAISTTKVRLLDSHVVNQIAAGEVVERPASVVKELVENALDSGATRIEVDLKESGKRLIRVADDGCGMSEADAMLALQRHATSKITEADDLLGVLTLGFRGEALPSIASVSRMTVSTAEADGARSVIHVDGGQLQPVTREAGPKGTEILVEDLFFNTPARLKFLKSDTTELSQCLEHLGRYAMAYPHVAFRVTHQGQEAMATTGRGDLLEAIAGVWGRDMARALAEVDSETGGIRVRGYVSPPHLTRPTRAYQYLFVNGRPVKSRMLTASLDQAYRDMTPERRYPMVVLMLEVDPAKIDVNVSPTKHEIKFQSEGQAFEVVRYAIRSALDAHGMMPSALGVQAANQALREAGATPSPSAGGFFVGHDGKIAWGDPARAALEAQRPLDEAMTLQIGAMTDFGEAPAPVSSERYPFADLLDGLRVIGQAMRTFIIAETRRGLVVVDQHVAHERIIYEVLCGLKGEGAVEMQPLLEPAMLHLDRRAAILLREKLDAVESVGFRLEPFGGESFLVRTVPAALKHKDPLRVLRDIADELVESAIQKRLTPTREQVWITTSCRMAVKAGDVLSIPEMEKLIVDLAATENPYMCPHGRPITITLTLDELLRKFKRI